MTAPPVRLDTVDSTNTYAKTHFDELSDGTLITAESQTAGRGRLNRKWASPPGLNIYATLIVKNPENPFFANIGMSLAVLDTFREAAPGVPFFIKWPNDIYSGVNKIAGILSEGVVRDGKLAGVVVGAGLNINMTQFPGADDKIAWTSLKILTKSTFFLEKIIFSLAKHVSACYIINSGFRKNIFDLWKSENILIGRTLTFEATDGQIFPARLTDIRPDGSLLLETESGPLVFSCGDVRIEKESLQHTLEWKGREK